jgi:hypothetical protein
MIGRVIDTSLKHTTTVAMSRNLNAVSGHGIVYELEAKHQRIIKCHNG